MSYLLALILFYQQYTGHSYFEEVLAPNFGFQNTQVVVDNQRDDIHFHSVGWRFIPHCVGDLNENGTTGQDDVNLHNSLVKPWGWAISTTSKVHPIRKCRYIINRTDITPQPIGDRCCLPCAAELLKESQ